MAWGESGQTVTWKNPQFVAENQRQSGGWYYNPDTNRVDRWWAGAAPSSNNNQPSYAGAAAQSSTNQQTPAPQVATDYNAIAQNQLSMYKEANKPVIESLNAAKAPLTERYKTLLDSITNQQGTAVSSAQTAATNEWSARGLPVESNAFQQFLSNRVSPVETRYQDLTKSTVSDEQSALADLAYKVAQAESGANTGALNSAFQLYQIQQAQKEQATKNALATYESPTDVALKNAQAAYYQAQAGKLASDTGGGNGVSEADALNSIFSGGAKTTSTGLSNINILDSLWNDTMVNSASASLKK